MFEQRFLNYPKKNYLSIRICEIKIRHSLFRYYENKTKSLALMEAASSSRSEEIQRTAGGLVLENTNCSAPEKTSTCQVVHNSIKFHFDTNFKITTLQLQN